MKREGIGGASSWSEGLPNSQSQYLCLAAPSGRTAPLIF